MSAILERDLYGPVRDLFSRPRKEFRSQLPALLLKVFKPSLLDSPELLACQELIEKLHAGSLVIDDIEDQSSLRRGETSLHLKYGLNSALNSGCWLYFDAFSGIVKSSLSETQRLRIYEASLGTLEQAHQGQAIDLGARVFSLTPFELRALCERSLQLKSGALMALGLDLGAILLSWPEEQRRILRTLGMSLGVSLQKYDDLGNLNCSRPTQKHLEDLALARPSFIWWWSAERAIKGSPHILQDLIQAIQKLPELKDLQDWVEASQIFQQAHKEVQTEWQNSWSRAQKLWLAMSMPSSELQELQKQLNSLFERISHAYSV
ncbi:MAG: polyprenyl synthetase family protein [Bdellovibrio sp.]